MKFTPVHRDPLVIEGRCPQAATFLARLGTAVGQRHRLEYAKLIRRLVANGIWSNLDALYIFATADQTTANLNLVSSSFGITANGSPTFTADAGYTGTDASATVYLDTGFNPSTATAAAYTQNSAHFSVWSNTLTASSASGGNDMGLQINTGVGGNVINCKYSNGSAFWRCNENTSAAGLAIADARGHYIANRTVSTADQGFKNSVNQGLTGVASTTLVNANFYILNARIGTNPSGGSGRQISAASIGGGLSQTQIIAFYNALHAYLVAIAGITY